MKNILKFALYTFLFIAATNASAQNMIGRSYADLVNMYNNEQHLIKWKEDVATNGQPFVSIYNKDADSFQMYYLNHNTVYRYVCMYAKARANMLARSWTEAFVQDGYNRWLDYENNCIWTLKIDGQFAVLIADPVK